MSTFVIGDVHGRRGQLQSLLAMLPFDHARGDTLVLLATSLTAAWTCPAPSTT